MAISRHLYKLFTINSMLYDFLKLPIQHLLQWISDAGTATTNVPLDPQWGGVASMPAGLEIWVYGLCVIERRDFWSAEPWVTMAWIASRSGCRSPAQNQ